MIDLNVIDLEKYCVSIIYPKSKISFSCYYELFPYLTISIRIPLELVHITYNLARRVA